VKETATTTVEFAPVEVVREEVPVVYGERIAKKLRTITKRLDKLGAPAPTVEFGPVVSIEYDDLTARELGWSGPPFPKPTWSAFETVTVNGFEAKHEGWTGVAVLDWTVNPDEAFVARFPGHDDEETAPEVSDELRTRGPVCDHCRKIRSRNNTIVFAHDDGRTIAVGTGCVLEYLGVDPRTILMLSDFVKSFNDEDDLATVAPSMDTVEFVALAAEITRFFGFVRSGEPDSTKELTTKIGILGLTNSRADRDLARELADAIDMERGRAKAAEIVAWLDAETDPSDFLRSAKTAIGGFPVEAGARHAGILAALPFSHDRHIGLVAEREAKRKAEAESRAGSEFVGEVGDRIDVTGTVVFFNTYDGHYGVSARLTMVTDDGNRVTTYGSGDSLFGWSTGDKIAMKGTVKDHDDDDRFGKSTVLTRVKATELGDDGKPLPACDLARCTKTGVATCPDCDRLVCGYHGESYLDVIRCGSCLEKLWESERERERVAKAMCAAATSMVGGPRFYSYNPIRGDALDVMVPAS